MLDAGCWMLGGTREPRWKGECLTAMCLEGAWGCSRGWGTSLRLRWCCMTWDTHRWTALLWFLYWVSFVVLICFWWEHSNSLVFLQGCVAITDGWLAGWLMWSWLVAQKVHTLALNLWSEAKSSHDDNLTDTKLATFLLVSSTIWPSVTIIAGLPQQHCVFPHFLMFPSTTWPLPAIHPFPLTSEAPTTYYWLAHHCHTIHTTTCCFATPLCPSCYQPLNQPLGTPHANLRPGITILTT